MFARTVYLLLIVYICVPEASKTQTLKPIDVTSPPTVIPTFQFESHETIRNISTILDIRNCFDVARDLAKKASGDPTIVEAITWINMYIRKCDIPNGRLKEDKLVNRFPIRLNKELRCTLELSRDPVVRDIFLQAARMIDKSLDKLRPLQNLNTVLYRGEKNFQHKNHRFFVEEAFFSTSTNIDFALILANGSTLLAVREMIGFNISNYAEKEYHKQEEVLAKRRTLFEIESTSMTNTTAIQTYIDERTRTTKKKNYPEEIIFIKAVPPQTINEGDLDITSRDQQLRAGEYCKPEP